MKPKKDSKDNHVGIEIECFGKVGLDVEMRKEFKKLGLSKNVSIGYDYSIRTPTRRVQNSYWCHWRDRLVTIKNTVLDDRYRGYEVRLLTKDSTFKSDLKKVFHVLNDLKLQVNKSCGLHVHLDMRNRYEKIHTIYNNLVKCQTLLFNLQDKGRQRNSYCRKNKFNNFFKHLMSTDNRKYRAINTVTLRKLSTIEVRIHHGSIDFDEVYGWIKTLLTICRKKGTLEKEVEKPNDFKRLVSKRKDLTNYIKMRYNKHRRAA